MTTRKHIHLLIGVIFSAVAEAARVAAGKGTACALKAWQSTEHGDRTLNRSLRHCARR
jgi:high-affinity K+ transport system ATPase subunit B